MKGLLLDLKKANLMAGHMIVLYSVVEPKALFWTVQSPIVELIALLMYSLGGFGFPKMGKRTAD